MHACPHMPPIKNKARARARPAGARRHVAKRALTRRQSQSGTRPRRTDACSLPPSPAAKARADPPCRGLGNGKGGSARCTQRQLTRRAPHAHAPRLTRPGHRVITKRGRAVVITAPFRRSPEGSRKHTHGAAVVSAPVARAPMEKRGRGRCRFSTGHGGQGARARGTTGHLAAAKAGMHSFLQALAVGSLQALGLP